MIISHKHKFIFFKSRKTAGSSIQTALAKHCGPDDIITGQYRDGIDDDSHSAGLNMDKFWTNHPHPPILETKRFLGEDVWKSYFKFAFLRNPYEIQVSRYFWEKRGKGDTVDECSIDGFREWVKSGEMLNHDLLYPYVMVGDNIELDYIGRYETLQWDFDLICGILKLPKTNLPVKKGGYRDKLHYSKYYDENTIGLVGDFHIKDIKKFGYDFNPEFSVSRMGPIITGNMLQGNLGNNINGASLIKVPDWVENPLGRYYLYFAHHSGKFIRMAYSDNIEGPWEIYENGALKLEDSACEDHVASPDVHVDNVNQRIVMYYHGVTKDENAPHYQCSFVSFSKNALDFNSESRILGMFYFRVFKYKDKFYAIAKNKNVDGIIYESDDWDGEFKPLFNLLPNIRHTACFVEYDTLYLFYTTIGDIPESIKVCEINLKTWEPVSVDILVEPTEDYEGVNLPLTKSRPGSSTVYAGAVRELRDPCIYKDYLLYSLKGEMGIGISKLGVLR